MLVQPCRLRLAMFKCDLLVSAAALGKVYTVIGRRSGRVVSEEMREGTDNFAVGSPREWLRIYAVATLVGWL